MVDNICTTRNFIICTLHPTQLSDQIKKGKMGRICSMHGRDENVYKISLEKPQEQDHLDNPGLGVDRRIRLNRA
jgi:hypothetical protein